MEPEELLLIRQAKNTIQEEALDAWENNGRRGTLHLYTGLGKTFVFFKSLYRIWPKGTNAKVYFFSESSTREFYVRKDALEFKKHFGRNPIKDFPFLQFRLYQSGHLISSEISGSEIEYGCFDEIQDMLTPTRKALIETIPFKACLGLTATPGEEKRLFPEKNSAGLFDKLTKGDLYATYIPIVYRYEVKDAVEEDIYSNIDIHVVYSDLDNKFQYKFFKGGTPCTEKRYYDYFSYLYEKELGFSYPNYKKLNNIALQSSRALAKLPSKVKIAKELVKIFEKNNEKTLILGNDLDKLNEITPNVVRSSSSTNNNTKEQKEINYNLMKEYDSGYILTIASFKILQQGANLSGMDNLILHSNFADNDKFLQRIGRARLSKSNTRVILLITRGTKEIDRLEDFIKPFKSISYFESPELYFNYLNLTLKEV